MVADTQQYSVSGKNVYYKQAGTLFPHTHYILGAHYDNMPPFPFYTVAPGADDNASGSAAVIEAARIFSQHIFPYSIVFALWDEEEQGMIGSTAWLSGFDTGSDTILAYINLDMLGYDGNDDSLAMIYTKPVAQSVQLANISMQCNLDYTIGLGNIVLLNPAPNSSDQATFWNSNYSAIDITEDHLNDFNPAYHTPFDTIGLLNLLYYEKVTKLAFATLATLAIDTNRILGIENISGEADPQFIVSPNPTSGEFELLPKISGSNILDISVYNSMGEKIVTASEKQGRLIFDLSPFPTGIYFLKAQNPKVRFSKKIILEH